NEDTSFFDTSNDQTAQDVYVADDNLFVAVSFETSGGGGGLTTRDTSAIFIFHGASTLVSDALPDAILFGDNSRIDVYATGPNGESGGLRVLTGPSNHELIIGNTNFQQGVCTDAPGIVGFFGNDSATGLASLFTGQSASVVLPQVSSNLGFAYEFQEAGG